MITFSTEKQHQIENKFKWLDYNDQYLEELRKNCNLSNLVNDKMDDLQIVKTIMSWVNSLWKHNGSNVPEHSDPLFILEEVSKGKQFRCVEYAIVLNGCLNALGLFSRVLALKTEDCETRESGAGHVLVEVFIPSMNKWIMADPQFNVITYKDNLPLNAVELALSSKDSVHISKNFDNGFSYFDWIHPYLYYFTIHFDNRVNNVQPYNEKEQLMLVPVNAKKPTVFQRVYPIGNVEYTNSLEDFYFTP